MTQDPKVGVLVTLEDERTRSRVVIAADRGALVSELTMDGRELLYLDRTTFEDPTKNVRGGIPVLFPSPGKLDGDRFSASGRSGAMKQHGFARTLPWRIATLVPDAARLTLELDSNATTRAQYPWEFHAELTFELDRTRLRLTLRVHNRDSAAMPFALGYHPYFQIADKRAARIDTGATRAFDNLHKREVAFSGFDFTASELDLHLLDHDARECTLRFGDGTRLVIAASEDFAVWVVWTLAGKEFICLEPWTARGNALNTGEQLLSLAPDATHESVVELEYFA